jgi:hypothetical protein
MVYSDVIPTAQNLDLCCEGRPVGILLISRAAAPPTPRAYQSAVWAAGIRQTSAERNPLLLDGQVVPARPQVTDHSQILANIPEVLPVMTLALPL